MRRCFNEAFDSSNALNNTQADAPYSRRFDYSLAGGGRIIEDLVFFFGSAERITENRQIGFAFSDTGSALVNRLLQNQGNPFDVPSRDHESRLFFKLNENPGRHQLSQEVNYEWQRRRFSSSFSIY